MRGNSFGARFTSADTAGHASRMPAAPPAIIDPSANGFQSYLNWQDVGNFWVSINPQSGLVTTTEALQVPATSWSGNAYGTFNDLVWSRKLARDAISMGGR